MALKTPTPTIQLDFRVLLYPEEGFWIAHCLETDLACEGSEPDEAFGGLVDITNALVEQALAEGDIKSVFSTAPVDILHMYALAPRQKSGARPLNLHGAINRVERRQYTLA